MSKIEYRNNIPYYKGMPCFIGGKRLNSVPKVNSEGFLTAYYWCDCGLWGIDVSEIYKNRYVYNTENLPMYLTECHPMTFNEWKEDNEPYTSSCVTIEQALNANSLDGGHGGTFNFELDD